MIAKGFVQEHGVDYSESCVLVASLDIVRVVLAITTQNRWKFCQMDLNSMLLIKIYDEI